MKTLIIFIICFLIGFYCIAQNNVFAKNDTLYFSDSVKVYVPKYEQVCINYLDENGNSINILKAPKGVYIKEYKSQEFTLIEMFCKDEEETQSNKKTD